MNHYQIEISLMDIEYSISVSAENEKEAVYELWAVLRKNVVVKEIKCKSPKKETLVQKILDHPFYLNFAYFLERFFAKKNPIPNR